ncbi:histidine kinase [Nesterenkonia aerolata]|uniref:Histidine kinase n=1 Tax=Nesterenkonia aerolata TaxID=3074079 RepID=A0ABU2DUX7_9MICC|nr:histidine kinase [Nesterenkonia sp. LY-0111]MDR8020317.1 histidine kinase [Nesterenkonia sp. LY-0111]
MRGSAVLAAAVLGIWALVATITQVLVSPALDTLPTLIIGVTLTLAAVLGYPSFLRGRRDRQARAARTARRDGLAADPDAGDLAAAARSMSLRSGLTPEAAARTVRLLRPMLSGDSVSITDREDILAFVGPGSDHHRPGHQMRSEATVRAAEGGRTVVAKNAEQVGCRVQGCPHSSAVVAPLVVRSRVVGTLGVFQSGSRIPPAQAVEDMAHILSLHLEMAELDRERQIAAHARLDALRAQINPHFLFNVLNTIASKSRTRPDEARELLVRLAEFFRYTVRQEGHFADFAQEYYFVRTYLSLEQARFGDRLQVRYDIDPQVLTSRVPVLTIQPLVENAVKHGLGPQPGPGTVRLKARADPLGRTVSIRVSDDGVGMPDDVLRELTRSITHPQTTTEAAAGPAETGDGAESAHAGVGLRNIIERLDFLYGDRYDLSVSTPASGGTVVDLRVPLS